MRAMLCQQYGPPESLQLLELPDPVPAKGQLLIDVEACGVNFPDTLIIEGKYQLKPELPFAPGGEVAGVVAAVGEGVDPAWVGQSVIALTYYGGFAEKVLVDEKQLLPRPAGMSGAMAAGFGLVYGTSMHALKQRAALKAGETLLVLGAGGGVGLAAVEIGALMGATVIAAASTPEKLEAARQAGATHLINYREQPLREALAEIVGKKGVDVVYDPVGGELFEQALRSTAWNGRALVVGFASGTIPKVPANLALLKGCSIVGVFWGTFRTLELAADNKNFEQLFAWYAEDKLHPVIGQTMPLERAGVALRALMDRSVIGKVVLTTELGA